MANDNRSFSDDLRKFCEKTKIKADTFVRKVTFDVLAEIIRRTPVDYGWARANWQIGIGERPDGTIGSREDFESKGKAKQGSGSYRAARAIQGQQVTATMSFVKAGGVNYIVNNVPYIMRLEEGWSKQAPAGMARVTVTEFQEIVNKALRSIA